MCFADGGEAREESLEAWANEDAGDVEVFMDSGTWRAWEEARAAQDVTVANKYADGSHSLAGALSNREGEEKLDDVRAAILGSLAESGAVVCGRVDATLQRQVKEKLDNARVAVLGSVAERQVVE